jgi:hypothetical protein
MMAGRSGAVGRTNDATRNQEFTIGTALPIILGGILGTQEINALPFIEQEQELLFREPIQIGAQMGIFASGMNSSGWAS